MRMEEEYQPGEIDRIFRTSKQAKKQLLAALTAYFSEDELLRSRQDSYAAFLRQRVRNAGVLLIEEGEFVNLKQFLKNFGPARLPVPEAEQFSWKQILELWLDTAKKEGEQGIFLWLLCWKKEAGLYTECEWKL